MFTGIIGFAGILRALRGGAPGRLEVECPELAGQSPEIAESIAVNGCCLTLVALDAPKLIFDVSQETLEKTTLWRLARGTRVNLERALRVGEPVGGHFVTGHVDGTARLTSRSASDIFRFEAAGELMKGIVMKGSVAVDGISLTVSDLGDNWFETAIIPLTLEVTNLGDLREGARVNIETDLLGKYVLKTLGKGAGGDLTIDFLKESGFA